MICFNFSFIADIPLYYICPASFGKMPDDNSEVLFIYIPGPPVLTFPDDRLPGPSAEMTGPEMPPPELPGPSVTTLSPGALPGLPGELDDGLLSVPGEGLLSVPDE